MFDSLLMQFFSTVFYVIISNSTFVLFFSAQIKRAGARSSVGVFGEDYENI